MVLSSRQKEVILWIIGVFTTVALLLLVALPMDKSEKRAPASIAPKQVSFDRTSDTASLEKIETLGKTENGIGMGKGGGSLKIEIRSNGKESIAPGSPLQLEAQIEALNDLNDLKFNWILPEGITATSVKTGSIGSLKKGESTTLTFAANASTSENKQIHLHVFRMVGGEAMGETAQYNTTLQPKLNAEIEKRAEVLKAESHGGKKFVDESSGPKLIQ